MVIIMRNTKYEKIASNHTPKENRVKNAFIAFISDVPVIFYCATTCVIDVSFISFFLESKYPCMCSLDIAGMNNVPALVL